MIEDIANRGVKREGLCQVYIRRGILTGDKHRLVIDHGHYAFSLGYDEAKAFHAVMSAAMDEWDIPAPVRRPKLGEVWSHDMMGGKQLIVGSGPGGFTHTSPTGYRYIPWEQFDPGGSSTHWRFVR